MPEQEPCGERELALALACAGAEVWVWDPAAATCVMSGYPVTPFERGRPHRREQLLVPVVEEDRHALELALDDASEHGELDVRFRIRVGDWPLRWLRVRGRRGPDGVRVIAACTDVTEVVEATNAELRRRRVVLRQNQALQRLAGRLIEGVDVTSVLTAICADVASALEVARVSVWVLDDGGATLRCVTLVEPESGLAGASRPMSEADYPIYFAALRRERVISTEDVAGDQVTGELAPLMFARGLSSRLDATCRIDGRVVGLVVLEHAGEPRRWSPEDHAFAASVADGVTLVIESRRRREAESAQLTLEESLRQAQKMEAVGLLAGGVAHDLNNLLTPVLMGAEMVREELADNADLAELTDSIIAAALDARALVSQLLAFSRKQVLELHDIDPTDAVRRAVKLLRRALPETIHIELDLAAGLAVRADAMQLQQVLLNLAINARDAMPAGGTLTIATRAVDADAVAIVVTDTGTGMDALTQHHIFEPFFTTKALGRGTGLGLSTVYGIIQQHGGTIHVDSTVGHGTRFEIHLPAAGSVAARATEQRAPVTGDHHGTILVVDDEPAVRGLVVRLLGREGYRVLDVGGPEDALELAARHRGDIHLVLTDVVMPGMNGRRMYEQISLARPEASVIYMSGYDADVLAPQGILATQVRLLRKPFTAADLLRVVHHAMSENASSPVDNPPPPV